MVPWGPWAIPSPHRGSTTAACPSTRSSSHYSTSTVSPTTNAIFGTDGATAPRSVRVGRRFRGSREGSLHSPARDPRLFHRPLRGRGRVRPFRGGGPTNALTRPRPAGQHRSRGRHPGGKQRLVGCLFRRLPAAERQTIRPASRQRRRGHAPVRLLNLGVDPCATAHGGDSAAAERSIPRPRSVRFRDRGAVDSATAERSIPRRRSGRLRDGVEAIPRPRSVRFRGRGAFDSATAERSIPRPRSGRFRDGVEAIPRPRSGRFRDRGAVDKIAVGRARASATSPRATRGTAAPHAPTAERSHRQSQR